MADEMIKAEENKPARKKYVLKKRDAVKQITKLIMNLTLMMHS